jgi:hypothetical protein
MLPQQRVGSDQEGSPARPREQAAEYGEDRSICGPIPNTSMELPLENTHLVPEHHDLDVLVRLRAPGRHDEAEDAKQAGIDE